MKTLRILAAVVVPAVLIGMWLAEIWDERGRIWIWSCWATACISLLLLSGTSAESVNSTSAAEEPPDVKVMRDATRQLITLAVGLVTLSLTFRNSLIPSGQLAERPVLLVIAWISSLVSVVLGFLFQFSVAGGLLVQKLKNLNSSQLHLLSLGQVLTFLAALLLFITYGTINFNV